MLRDLVQGCELYTVASLGEAVRLRDEAHRVGHADPFQISITGSDSGEISYDPWPNAQRYRVPSYRFVAQQGGKSFRFEVLWPDAARALRDDVRHARKHGKAYGHRESRSDGCIKKLSWMIFRNPGECSCTLVVQSFSADLALVAEKPGD